MNQSTINPPSVANILTPQDASTDLCAANDQSTPESASHYSSRAALVAIAIWLCRVSLFEPIAEQVKIEQKTVKHSPVEKLLDAFICILAGGHGIVEINKRVQPDRGLQKAFGRQACAEQSVVQETLNACTEENVEQMHDACDKIFQSHSSSYRHDYTTGFLILDADMTGQPCGKKAQFASKGYFANERNRRGRQLGRIVASQYHEVVVDRLFSGTVQLAATFPSLMQAAEKTLGIDGDEARWKRERTIVRMDSGGGTIADINWALKRGYRIYCKDYSAQRARKLAEEVERWVPDPQVEGREVGLVTTVTTEYVCPVTRVAVRCRKNNGQWGYGVLISALSNEEVMGQMRQSKGGRRHMERLRGVEKAAPEDAVLLAYVYFYDERGGGVETEIKEDKQGLGMTKRNKKRFAAQQMVVQLGALAHNVTVWTRRELSKLCPKLEKYGILRLIRDVFQISGKIVFDAAARVTQIVLNEADSIARAAIDAFRALLQPLHVAIILGQT